MSDYEFTVNRQDIITHEGLHYKQNHRLIGIDYNRDYDDVHFLGQYSPHRFMTSESRKYMWQPMNRSEPFVEAECGRCGSSDVVFVTRSIKDAIKAGFLKLVAPITR